MENNNKSLKKNMVMNAILTMSGFLFPLITFPYASRILLPEGTGKVAFATSVVMYFAMFAQLGVPIYGIRACAKVRDSREKLTKTVQEILSINIIMTCIVYIVFFICVFNINEFRRDKSLFIVVGASILFGAIGVEWLYKALEKFTYITICSVVFKIIALIAMFILVKDKNDYVIYGGISIFAASASGVMNFLNLRKHIDFKLVGGYNFRQHYKMIVTFFAMSIATTIYTNLDTVMLGFMKTDADVGYYNAAVKIKNILVSIVTAVSTVLLPRVSYFIEKGRLEEFWKVIKKTINFVVLISVPMTIYFIIFAKEGINFLSGSQFYGAILPMQIIMPTLIFIGLTNVMGIQMLVPMNKEIYVLKSEIAGAVVDLIINIILIPRLGAIGAAIGTLVAEMFVLGYQYFVLREHMKDIYKKINYKTIIFATCIAVASSYWVKLLDLSDFITLVISAIFFFVMYIVILTICREPIIIRIEEGICSKIKGNREKS